MNVKIINVKGHGKPVHVETLSVHG